MSNNTFLRSFKLVPEISRPFLWSSLIALTGSGLRMIGPQLISRGIDNGVLKSDYQYLLQQSFFYFITLVLLYFVASKALLAIGLVGESYVRNIREKLFKHLASLDIHLLMTALFLVHGKYYSKNNKVDQHSKARFCRSRGHESMAQV